MFSHFAVIGLPAEFLYARLAKLTADAGVIFRHAIEVNHADQLGGSKAFPIVFRFRARGSTPRFRSAVQFDKPLDLFRWQAILVFVAIQRSNCANLRTSFDNMQSQMVQPKIRRDTVAIRRYVYSAC